MLAVPSVLSFTALWMCAEEYQYSFYSSINVLNLCSHSSSILIYHQEENKNEMKAFVFAHSQPCNFYKPQCIKSTVFWDIMLSSSLKVHRCFWGTYRLHLLGSKNKPSKELVLVENWWTKQRYIPGYSAVRHHCCENLRSTLCINCSLYIAFMLSYLHIFQYKRT
jgi:hypothetical protein